MREGDEEVEGRGGEKRHVPRKRRPLRLTGNRDEAALSDTPDTARNGALPTDLNDKIDPPTPIEPLGLLVPLLDLGIIDKLQNIRDGPAVSRGFRDEGLQHLVRPVEFGLGGRGEDDAGAGGEGDLRGREGDAARAETEDGLARLEFGLVGV